MPGSPIRIVVRVRHRRQSSMHDLALGHGRLSIHSGADQRVAKPHPSPEFDQPGGLRTGG